VAALKAKDVTSRYAPTSLRSACTFALFLPVHRPPRKPSKDIGERFGASSDGIGMLNRMLSRSANRLVSLRGIWLFPRRASRRHGSFHGINARDGSGFGNRRVVRALAWLPS
jgi:hypothetical protein